MLSIKIHFCILNYTFVLIHFSNALSFEKLFCIFVGRCHEKCHEILKSMQFTFSCICHTKIHQKSH